MTWNTTANLGDFLRRLTREMAAENVRGCSDQQLVEQILAGNAESAFQALLSRHGSMVYRVCWRVLHHAEDAEDAFQATFLVLARKLRSLRKHASLASWLHGVARRTALKSRAHAAAQRRREHRASASESAPSVDELRPVLDIELSRLADKWRLPLILCYLEGFTQDEAANQLGVSKTTLRNRLEEGRKMLARRLTQRGMVWPAVLSSVLLSDCIAQASQGLLARAVDIGVAIVAGKAAAVSTNVTILAKGVLTTMYLSKLKTPTLAVLLAFGVFVFASGVGRQQTTTAQPRESQPVPVAALAEPAPPQDNEPPKPPAEKRDRAFRIEVNQSGTAAGEYVDILASGNPSKVANTVVTGVKVLAVTPPHGRLVTLTLEVSSSEAESLALAQEQSPLRVSRRVATIPSGYRLTGIRVRSADIVEVGSTVDVLSVVRMADGAKVQTVVHKAKVHAVESPAEKGQTWQVVILSVTPEQTLRLSLAEQYGVLRLVTILPGEAVEKQRTDGP